MDNIIYEEETVQEVVFEGDFTLDGHMSEEEQRQSIFQMMRDAGIEVGNENEYTIGYDGVEDDNGISETQTSHFVVTRTYQKQVPYRLKREEVYSGEWILDGLRITPEEQNKRIFNEARKAGVKIQNEDEYEIGYEGVEDDNGISETQKTRYVIYHVTKEKITDQDNLSEQDRLRLVYEELKILREKVRNTNNPDELSSISTRMNELSDLLDRLVDDATRDYSPFERALGEVESQIEEIKEEILANMRLYLESYDRIKELVREQAEIVGTSMNPQEFDDKVREIMNEKNAENTESLAVHDIIDQQLEDLKKLAKKRDRIRKDFESAKELGISAHEYRELTNNFRSRNLLNAILEKKGLGDILAVPAKDRTPEQKRRIKAIRKEVFEELAKVKKENEDKSVLKLVEALYGIETEVKLKGKQRVLIIRPHSLENIKKNASKMPEKIPGKEEAMPSYQPGEAPEDMVEVLQKRAEDAQAQFEEDVRRRENLPRVILYRDMKYPDKLFAKEEVFAKFNLMEEGEELQIEGEVGYELPLVEAEDILASAYDDREPYVVEFHTTSVVYAKDQVMGPIPYNDSLSTVKDKITIFEDKDGKVYVRKPLLKRFDLEPLSSEVRIEGTACFEVSKEDIQAVEDNADNLYSPYIVEHRFTPVVVVREQKEVKNEEKFTPRGLNDQLTVFLDESGKYYVRKPVFDRFDVEPLGIDVRLNGTVGNEISYDDVERIVLNQNNDVSPYNVVFRKVDLGLTKEQNPEEEEKFAARGLNDQLTVFLDEDGKYYVRKPAFERFDVEPIGEEVRLNGAVGNEISYDDVEEIVLNQNNETSPYNVVFRKINSALKRKEPVVETPKVEESFAARGLNDQLTVFLDENGKYYMRKPAFERFDATPIGEEVRLDGTVGYEVSYDEVKEIVENQNNETSPYNVIFRKVNLDLKKEDKIIPPVVEEEKNPSTGLKDQVTVFLDNDGKYYVRKPAFERFDVEPHGEEVRLNGTAGHEIAKEDVQEIVNNKDNEISPYNVVFRKVDLGKVKEQTSSEVPPVIEENTSDEYIPGTNFKKPRERGIHETDEEYVNYLKNYYESIFGPQEKTEVKTGPIPYNDSLSTVRPIEHITIYRDQNEPDHLYARKYVFTRFDIEPIGEGVRVAGALCYPIAKEDVQEIEANAHKGPSPYDVIYMDIAIVRQKEQPKEEEKQNETMANREGLKDQLTVFLDENGKYYVRKPAFERFDVEPLGEEVRLDGTAGHEILKEDVQEIVNNKDNELSPYNVVFRKVNLGLKREEKAVEEVKQDEKVASRGLKDQLTVFLDENGKYYVRKPAFERFDVEPLGEEVRLDGTAGNEIAKEDVQEIVNNQNNEISPYNVVFRKVNLGLKKPEPVVEKPEPEKKEPVPKKTDPEEEIKKEVITLFRDINDHNQVYAPDAVLKRFGIKTLTEPTMVEGVPSHKISGDTDQIINNIAKMSKNPKLVVEYKDVKLKELTEEKPIPHVEEIIDKITDGLDIRAKDCKRYRASNMKIAKGFSDELHSGNYAYNIVHVVPATLKAGVGFFRKLSGSLMTSARARDAMKTIEERLGALSDEELDVLFEEYKGTQLKTDMNNQINPLILERLKEFGLSRVATLNARIQKDYTTLFTLLGQIKALEEKMKKSGKENGSLENQRQTLMSQASACVQSIVENRKKANNILSSGIHGLEEDFKAVSTKLSYVGMRFAKTSDFDNDLQHRLGEFGRKLNTAIAKKDDEEIVKNFMGLETCYYENTEIRGSLAGKRSVGSKYYSPVAEQFDYRDDPFIRDLFTTVAVTSAAISAINAIRVHQIESREILEEQKAQANTVNAHNQATINYVHQTGRRISDKRETFKEGMEAQAEQDVLTNADVRERAHLDSTNWQFNNAYHAADSAGHAAYNQFNADVTREINAVTADYAQGLITQAEALERMAQISSDAQSTLESVVGSCLPILKDYAATHPQFDLTAVQQSMEYIVNHPGAIADMNQSIVEVTNLADGLQTVQAMPMSALEYLPSDMASTIVCAATSAVLAANVSSTMAKAGKKKGTYGNEITDMMDDYLSGEEVEEEEKVAKK